MENTIESNDSNGMLRFLEARIAGTQEAPATSEVVTQPETTTTQDDIITKPAAEDDSKADSPLKKGFDALTDDAEEKTPETNETPADDNDAPADAKTPEAKNAWSAIKAEAKTLRDEKQAWVAEKARLASELEAAKKISDLDPIKKEAEELRKRVEELEPVVARAEYKKSAIYQQSIEKPMSDIAEAAVALAKAYEITDVKVLDALREPDQKRQAEMLDEIAESMNGRDRSRLYGMADRLDQLYRLDDQMSANASKALAEANALEAQEAEKLKNERRAAEMRAIHESKGKLEKATKFFKLEGETDEGAVKSVIDEANAVPFDEMETGTKTFSVIAGTLVPRMQKVIKELRSKLESRDREVAGLSGSTARTTQGSTPNTVQEEPANDMITALRRQMERAGINTL